MSEKYELHISKMFNIDTKAYEPIIKLIITKEQLDIIETFADVERNDKLEKTYILNRCRFRVVPHLEIKTEA